MTCPRCGTLIQPGQLYRMTSAPVHVACPSSRQVRQARRMGRVHLTVSLDGREIARQTVA